MSALLTYILGADGNPKPVRGTAEGAMLVELAGGQIDPGTISDFEQLLVLDATDTVGIMRVKENSDGTYTNAYVTLQGTPWAYTAPLRPFLKLAPGASTDATLAAVRDNIGPYNAGFPNGPGGEASANGNLRWITATLGATDSPMALADDANAPSMSILKRISRRIGDFQDYFGPPGSAVAGDDVGQWNYMALFKRLLTKVTGMLSALGDISANTGTTALKGSRDNWDVTARSSDVTGTPVQLIGVYGQFVSINNMGANAVDLYYTRRNSSVQFPIPAGTIAQVYIVSSDDLTLARADGNSAPVTVPYEVHA